MSKSPKNCFTNTTFFVLALEDSPVTVIELTKIFSTLQIYFGKYYYSFVLFMWGYSPKNCFTCTAFFELALEDSHATVFTKIDGLRARMVYPAQNAQYKQFNNCYD